MLQSCPFLLRRAIGRSGHQGCAAAATVSVVAPEGTHVSCCRLAAWRDRGCVGCSDRAVLKSGTLDVPLAVARPGINGRVACSGTEASSGWPCRSRDSKHIFHDSRRGFGTAAYSVKARDDEPEQTIFVVGLNEGKFFGQDGAEEGLKLLEQVADHEANYHLLFGITEKELQTLEEDHKTKGRKLTPSRELEKEKFGEFIPIMQAGMVDKRPRRAIGRELRITQAVVAWLLWKNPREAVNLYWAFWRRSTYKDAARGRFWMEHFPLAAPAYFVERSELVAIRTIEHVIIERLQRRKGTTIVIVNNELFGYVTEILRVYLGEDPAERMASLEFPQELRERAVELCRKIPDLTSLVIFIYVGIPMLVLQQVYLAAQYVYTVSREGEIEYDLDKARE